MQGCPYDVLDMLDRRRSHMDIVPVMRESPSEAPTTPSLPLIAGASAAASVVVVLILYGAYRVFAPRGSAAGSKAEALKEIQVTSTSPPQLLSHRAHPSCCHPDALCPWPRLAMPLACRVHLQGRS